MSEAPSGSFDHLDESIVAPAVRTDDPAHWYQRTEDGFCSALGQSVESRFELGNVIEQDSHIRVTIGKDRALGRRVTIKEPHPDAVSERRALARFVAEAQVVAQLQHPSVAPIYAAEVRDDGTPAFSMRHLDGRTMHAYLDACRNVCEDSDDPDRPHGLAARLEIFLKVCEAISYAHEHGVVHRDLKPDNVMLGHYGEVYVTHWGLAHVEDPATRPAASETKLGGEKPGSKKKRLTAVGEVIGSPSHMAPEQAHGNLGELGPATDQYGLGMILHELVCLRPPRPADADSAKLLKRALDNDNDPVKHRHGHRVAAGLRAVVSRATALDPKYRYLSVDELADDVRRYLRGEELAVAPFSLPQRVGRLLAANPTILVVIVFAAIAAGGIGVIRSLRASVQSQQTSLLRTQQVSELTAYVSGAARDMDISAQQIRTMLETLASEAEARHATPADPELAAAIDSARLAAHDAAGDWYYAADFDGGDPPSSALESKRYGRTMSYRHPSYWLATDADVDGSAADLARLEEIDDRMRSLAVRTVAREHVNARPSFQADFLRQDTSAVQFAYIGLRSGLLLNFPGIGGFTEDYDPRKRPWYARSKDSKLATYGPPYVDVAGTGVLVPCNIALHDEKGAFLGVAGIDVRLSDMARTLEMDRETPIDYRHSKRPPLRGWQASALVDLDGKIVIDDTDLGQADGGTHKNEIIEREPYPDDEVLEAITFGRDSGVIQHDDHLLVYQRLTSVGWYLVVRVDATAYAGTPTD